MKKKKNVFDEFAEAGIGLAKIGLVTGIGSSIATKSGVPELNSSFNTISGFTGIATNVYSGGIVLKQLKKLK